MKLKDGNETKGLVRKLTGLEKELYEKWKELLLCISGLKVLAQEHHSRLFQRELKTFRRKLWDLEEHFNKNQEEFLEPSLLDKDLLDLAEEGFFSYTELFLKMKEWAALEKVVEKGVSLLVHIFTAYIGKDILKLQEKFQRELDQDD